MPPGVVIWILKQVAAVFVFQIQLVASSEIDVCPKYDFVRVLVNMLFYISLGKIGWLRDILRDV